MSDLGEEVDPLDEELDEFLPEGADEENLEDEEPEVVVEKEVEPEEDEEEDEDESEESEDDDDDDDELLRAAEEDVEDDAPFWQEQAGYHEDFDWTTLTEEERLSHEQVLSMTKAELGALNYKRLNVLDRWAAAQAFAIQGLRDAFQEACRSILKSRRKHDGLMYEDIYLELISDLADAGDFEEAFSLLKKFRKQFPEEEEIYQRVNGLLMIESGEIHEGKSILDALMAKASDHGELHLELADDLLAMGHPELSLNILDRGKDFARRNRDTELMTALDETMRLALAHIEGDD